MADGGYCFRCRLVRLRPARSWTRCEQGVSKRAPSRKAHRAYSAREICVSGGLVSRENRSGPPSCVRKAQRLVRLRTATPDWWASRRVSCRGTTTARLDGMAIRRGVAAVRRSCCVSSDTLSVCWFRTERPLQRGSSVVWPPSTPRLEAGVARQLETWPHLRCRSSCSSTRMSNADSDVRLRSCVRCWTIGLIPLSSSSRPSVMPGA